MALANAKEGANLKELEESVIESAASMYVGKRAQSLFTTYVTLLA